MVSPWRSFTKRFQFLYSGCSPQISLNLRLQLASFKQNYGFLNSDGLPLRVSLIERLKWPRWQRLSTSQCPLAEAHTVFDHKANFLIVLEASGLSKANCSFFSHRHAWFNPDFLWAFYWPNAGFRSCSISNAKGWHFRYLVTHSQPCVGIQLEST